MTAVQKPQMGKRAWTDAQRAEQGRKLRARKIWLKSTGPKTPEGKSISCLNALTHGATSRPAKDFQRHFRLYYTRLRMAFHKKWELITFLKNELRDPPAKKPLSSLIVAPFMRVLPQDVRPRSGGSSQYRLKYHLNPLTSC
jgi:hypothetical protein